MLPPSHQTLFDLSKSNKETLFSAGRALTDCSKISTAEGAAEAPRQIHVIKLQRVRDASLLSPDLCSRTLWNTRAGIPYRPCQPVGKPVWVRSPSAAAPQLNTLILPVRRQHRCCTLGLFLISLTNLWEMSSRVWNVLLPQHAHSSYADRAGGEHGVIFLTEECSLCKWCDN